MITGNDDKEKVIMSPKKFKMVRTELLKLSQEEMGKLLKENTGRGSKRAVQEYEAGRLEIPIYIPRILKLILLEKGIDS